MEDFAKKYLAWYQGLSKVLRALLCFVYNIPNALYRFSKSALKKNNVGIVVAIIAIFGGFLLFIFDLVCIIAFDKVYWLDDFGLEEANEPAKAEEPAAEEAPAEEPAEAEAPAEAKDEE